MNNLELLFKRVERGVTGHYCDVDADDVLNLIKIIRVQQEALLKIYEPMKYHHWEEDPYTRAGCFQFVAQEVLKEVERIAGE